MKCNVRPLNQGECFCCSTKRAKEIFRDTNVYLDFAYLGRYYSTFAETADGYYVKHNVKGHILASMLIRVKDSNPILSFYVIKSESFSKTFQDEFEHNYLHEFYKIYQEQMSANPLASNTILLLVEFVDGKLKMHKAPIDYR